MTISQQIARFVVDFSSDKVSSELNSDVFEILKLSLVDWSAVGIAGKDEPVSSIVRRQALVDGGRAASGVFGCDEKLPPKAAALVNGTVSHALDYDDTHFMHVGHTSVVVFSACLAIAQAHGSTGRQFLDAALIGSEVCCYVGAWLGRSHYQAGFHQTATAGSFGATAAACRLLGLNHMQTCHAMGLAATRASGLTSQFGTMSKPYHAGMAASNGVEAALLASSGFTARPDGLECDRGFGQTHQSEQGCNDAAIHLLGEEFVFGAVQHKFHACCHGLHACIEALQGIKNQHHIDSAIIESITVETNPRWLKVCNIARPSTALESKFSYRHSCALVFSDYDSSALSTYSDECCADSTLDNIKDRTHVVANPDLHDTASSVRIQLFDGSVYQASHDLADILPTLTRKKRVLQKSQVLLGDQLSANLWSNISGVESLDAADFSLFCDMALDGKPR